MSHLAQKHVRVSEHRVHVATDADLDLRPATGEEPQDLQFVLRALVGPCVYHDRGRPTALRDEYGSCVSAARLMTPAASWRKSETEMMVGNPLMSGTSAQRLLFLIGFPS